MPPRPTLPADDLYARLEISVDASPEAIEVAWRSLLRLHHPDVAGPVRSRACQADQRRPRLAERSRAARPLRPRAGRCADPSATRAAATRAGTPGRDVRRAGPDRPAPRPRPIRPRRSRASSTASRPSSPTRSTGSPAPSRRRSPSGRRSPGSCPRTSSRRSQAMATAVDARLDPAAAAPPGVRDAVEGYGTELVLGDFLDELLTEPFRERARERLTRGWEAAVGQPRYGPNGVAVRALHRAPGGPRRGRRRGARRDGRTSRVATGSPTSRGRPGTSPDDDEALRVSSILAARDAARRSRPVASTAATLARARRSAAPAGPPARPAPRLRADRVRVAHPAVATALPARRPAGRTAGPPAGPRLTGRRRQAARAVPRACAMLAPWSRGWSRSWRSWRSRCRLRGDRGGPRPRRLDRSRPSGGRARR